MSNDYSKLNISKREKEILESADSLCGKHSRIVYRADISRLDDPKKSKVRKKGNLVGKEVYKISEFTIRSGLEYANQKAVIEKHESGERERVGLPDYMTKINRSCYMHDNGTVYLSCAPSASDAPRSTQWLVDGVITDFEDIKDDLTKAAYTSNERDRMSLITSNIMSLSACDG